MAKILGIHRDTLLSLKRLTKTFKEGKDYRFSGLTRNKKGSRIQWHPISAQQSFSSSKRIPVASVETFARGKNIND